MKLCIKNIFRQWIFLIEVQWDLQGWNFKSQSLQPLQDIALQVVQALFGKFKKWSKILASVLKTCVYDVRSSKNFFWLNWRFPWRAIAKTCSLAFCSAICPLHVIYKANCRPKEIDPVCLTFEPLRLQMTTIA